MKRTILSLSIAILSTATFGSTDAILAKQLHALEAQTISLQKQIAQLQTQLKQKNAGANVANQQHDIVSAPVNSVRPTVNNPIKGQEVRLKTNTHNTGLTVHELDEHPDSIGFYPTALLSDEHVVTYIAGTPVVSSPYLGNRPAFDGSDFIVNISSINRDIRLMQQRRRLYQAYDELQYPSPTMPIIAISGKIEPFANVNHPFVGDTTGDVNLGSAELDVATSLNRVAEGFMSFAFGSPTFISNQRIANSDVFLNLGFINIGDLDRSPLYFTAGQLFAPFGRYSSAMVSPPLALTLARTKARMLMFGYKSQQDSGPYASVYGFKSDTTLGKSGVGGINAGYIIDTGDVSGELGVGYIGSIADSNGMQLTSPVAQQTFSGFGDISNGNENVHKVQGVDIHGFASFNSYNFTAEWVSAASPFQAQDLSFNGRGAKPSAGQFEVGYTFKFLDKPASIGASYQYTQDSLALLLPKQRISALFSISLWQDTVESLEYRHDIDYKLTDFGNGLAPAGVTNLNTFGTGGTADTLTAQIGVYF
jgi:hypothetical protein